MDVKKKNRRHDVSLTFTWQQASAIRFIRNLTMKDLTRMGLSSARARRKMAVCVRAGVDEIFQLEVDQINEFPTAS